MEVAGSAPTGKLRLRDVGVAVNREMGVTSRTDAVADICLTAADAATLNRTNRITEALEDVVADQTGDVIAPRSIAVGTTHASARQLGVPSRQGNPRPPGLLEARGAGGAMSEIDEGRGEQDVVGGESREPIATPARDDTSRGAPQEPGRVPKQGRHTRFSAAWFAVVVAVVLGVGLVVFIAQNTRDVRVDFFTASGKIPVAVALLAAALAGALVVVAIGVGRVAQLRLSMRRQRRHAESVVRDSGDA